LQKIVPHLVKARYGVFAVLGNHDFVEMVAEMEKIGIQVLINETVILEKDNQALYLTGIDELLYQKKEGFDRKLFKLDKKNFNIFATHSPEFITLVAPNYSLYLCGHTHGGQICLPNGKLIVLNTGAPLAFCQGKWKFLNMQGYTSSGAGTSGLPVRFHCPSEISIHQLHRK
jgi:predicted MPP superfamily phosphohydrolase